MTSSKTLARRRFLMGAGAIALGTPTLLQSQARAQDLISRDPDPQFQATDIRPSRPAVLKRWDMSTNDLPATDPWRIDTEESFRNGPVVRVDVTAPQQLSLVNYTAPEPGLGRGKYQMTTVLKGERVSGPIAGRLTVNFANGQTYDLDVLMEASRRRFDWSSFPIQFGSPRPGSPMTGVSLTLNMIGTGVIWLGAVQLIDLGLPEDHVYFQADYD